ncbi:replication protein, partial [Xanthomonas citri pv. citri]|nr:replication protein [Xanthomonas citri pv. citri]
KNDTLLNLFQITQDEQRQLRTIIGRDMALERDRKRDEARRRAAGAVDRQTYESRSATRTRPWEALGMSRRSWYRAGKPAGPTDGT